MIDMAVCRIGVFVFFWDIEDWIRDCEREKRFDEEFIQLARSVYVTNDQRSEVKKLINKTTGSDLVEEKSYKDYKWNI